MHKASNACPLLQRALQVEDAVAHSRGLYTMLLFSTKSGLEPSTSSYSYTKVSTRPNAGYWKFDPLIIYIYYIFLHSTRRHVSLYADFPHIGLTVSHDLTAPDTPLRVPVYHTMHSIQYVAFFRPSQESNPRRRATLIQEYPLSQTRAMGNFAPK